jgi:carboxymethylenebutenolidase
MLNDIQQDINSLLPGKSTEQGATLRTALKAAIGVGYAASCNKAAAEDGWKRALACFKDKGVL